MEEIAYRWIGALGFPICTAVACGWVLYRLGSRLVDTVTKLIDATTTEIPKQTQALAEIKEALPRLCLADQPPRR